MHPQTLRMYEARGLITPKRSPKNTRLYSFEDVERLRRIQRMTARGGPQPGRRRDGARARATARARPAPSSSRMRERATDAGARDARPRSSGCKRSLPGRARALRRLRRRRDRPGADQAQPVRIPVSGSAARAQRGLTGRRAARPIHDQVPGGRRRRAAARRRAPQPRGRSRAPAAGAARPGGRPRRARAAEARRRRRRRSASGRSAAVDGPARSSAATPSPTFARRRPSCASCSGPRGRWPALGDEYISTEHLLLALADKSSGLADLLPDRDSLAEGDLRGPRAAPRHLARTPRTRCRRSRSSAAT